MNLFWRNRGKLLVAGFLGVAFLVAGFLFCRSSVIAAGKDRIFEDVSNLEPANVALVLGCASTLGDGRENLYFKHRIEATTRLWEAGKIQHILVSGDNSRPDYDEPSDMKAALVAAGLPADRIHRDYAGFRTLDSVVRARDVFQQTEFIIVSQRFHLERALYLAKELGVDAYGYPARDVGGTSGRKTQFREELARVKAVLDMKILNTQPKYRGAPVALTEAE